MDHTYTYIGRDAPVNDAAAKATGQLAYAADLHLPGMLYMKLLLSPVAHGLVRSLDTSAALALPGVAAVLSFQNTPSVKYNRGRVRATDEAPDQETLFTDHVRFVGDRIAAVVAQTPEIAQQAVSLLRADIQPLPPVFNLDQALEGAPVPLHERDDIIHLPVVSYGDYASAQGEEFCHHTATQRVSHIAMETHCAVADYTPATGRMTVWTATQSVFGVRSAISTILDLPMSRIRVIKTPMGGSFGCKQEMILEPLAACAAKMTGRPVMLHFSRSEVMLCTMLKHPLESDIKVKFSPQRTITGLQLHCRLDAGAYQTVSPDYAGSISKKLSWVYNIPHMEYYGTTVCTNTPTTGSYRGWGGPEAAIIMENMMNAAARHFSMDPIELRLRNILPPYAISRINNFSLGNLPLEDALLLGRERFAWEERKARLAVQDRSGRYARGIGMALSTHTSGYFPRKGDWGTVVVKMEEDGSVCVNCNVHDHGCGEVAVFKAIVGEVLSISPELVDLPEGDTAYNALDNGCYTSRSIYVLGRAILDASKKLLEQLRRMTPYAQVPLIAKPSAGLPGQHPCSPKELASYVSAYAYAGVRLFGGCCGAGAEHIAALKRALGQVSFSSFRAPEQDPDVIPCASEREARFITPDIDVGETIECTPDLMEDILEAEENSPQGALKIAVLEEDDLDMLAENQYVVKDALCIFSDVPELLERALRLYQGRAFWDGTGELEEAFLEEMKQKYGLILL